MTLDDQFAEHALESGALKKAALERLRKIQNGRLLVDVALEEGAISAEEAGRILSRISPHRRFGDLALEHGFITPEQLEVALREQRDRPGETLGQLLLRKRQLTIAQLLALLREQIVLAPVARRIGGYAVEGTLGEGPRGLVFRARDETHGREVALRIIQAGDPPDSGVIVKILQEVRRVEQLRHPNIARVYECGLDGALVFVAVELVEGKSLSDWWSQDRPGVPRALEAIEQIARAVHAAHEMGLVHGDLRPGHLMVDAKGVPRIADFGVPRVGTVQGDISALCKILRELLGQTAGKYATAAELAEDLLRRRTGVPPKPVVAPPPSPRVETAPPPPRSPVGIFAGLAAILFGLVVGAFVVTEASRRQQKSLEDLSRLLRLTESEKDGAIAGFTEDIALHPGEPAAYANRGLTYFAKGDFEGAASDFRKALDLAPPRWHERRRVQDLLDRCLRERGKN